MQVAAVIGIGLVYQGTGHRHNAEVLLSEIGVCEREKMQIIKYISLRVQRSSFITIEVIDPLKTLSATLEKML